MRMSAINEVITKKVAEYIANGYILNPISMKGHQGEECKVDLMKDNQLIRIWLNREVMKDSDGYMTSNYCLVLRVGTWKYPANKVDDFGLTVWMNEFDVHEEILYYEIGKKWYTDSREEAELAIKKHIERFSNRRRENGQVKFQDSYARLMGAHYLKRSAGYQRITTSDVQVKKVTDEYGKNTYQVVYNGKYYRLS